MVMIIVPSYVLDRRAIPAELQPYIAPQLWNHLLECLKEADDKSRRNSRIVELVVCICLAFPFIFCCHGCIYSAMSEQRRMEKLNAINRTFFFGKPVLSTAENHAVMVNTDYIQQEATYGIPVAVTEQLRMNPLIEQNNIISTPHDYDTTESYNNNQHYTTTRLNSINESKNRSHPSSLSSSSNTSYIPTHDVHVLNPSAGGGGGGGVAVGSSNTRTLWIMLPDEARAGSTLSVPLPDGRYTNIIVPMNRYPGQKVEVPY